MRSFELSPIPPMIDDPTLPSPTAFQSARDAREDLERAREATARSIERLVREFSHRFDWRRVFGAHPLAWLGGSLCAGLWLGSRGSAPPRHRSRFAG